MLLTVDIGNSHTVIGTFQKDTLIAHWRLKTDRKITSDEISASLFGLLAMKKMTFREINGFIVACVVPQVLSSWLEFAAGIVDNPLQVDEISDTGITVVTDNPAEVGADRIVNAAAAFAKYVSALVIVDFGTAITFDCVSGKGEYLGGAIAPGLGISLEALGEQTAKLPRVDISSPPKNAIGTNTIEAIKSGILFGYGSMVDGLIEKICLEFSPEIPKVIATGGMAPLIARYSSSIEAIDPHLTLQGLALLYKRIYPNG
jgi:type III pantothenate kinase